MKSRLLRRAMPAVLFIIIGATQALTAATIGLFVPTGEMTTPRAEHTATLLRSGKVLIAGGLTESNGALATAELYDPSTGTFTATGSMSVARRMHTATLLNDGRVLIAGGWSSPAELSTAELYDPESGTFTATGSLLEAQGGHAATLLANGKVLIAGGERGFVGTRAELYDPATGTFSFAGNYAGHPLWPTSHLLPDGRVLVAGGNPADIYDPVSDTFTAAGSMIATVYRYGVYWHTGTSLSDGRVLITGGNDDMSCTGFANAELYDPSSRSFTDVANMTAARDGHAATLLRDGSVLISGGGPGWCGISTLASAERFDPAARSFVAAGNMNQRRAFHTMTLLDDGTVLIAGGLSYWPFHITPSAELYRAGSSRRRAAGR